MSAIIVATVMPAEVVVLSEAAIEAMDVALIEASGLVASTEPMDEERFAICNVAYKALGKLRTGLEGSRKELVRPFNTVVDQINAAAKEYLANLLDAEKRLGAKLLAFEAVENAKRDALREAAIAEAKAKEAEQIAWAEAERRQAGITEPTKGEIVRPVEIAATPPPLKSAARSKPEWELIIDNEDLIPVKIGNVRLLVRDDAAIKQVMRAGFEVAGCRLIKRQSTAPKARGGAA